MNEGERQAAKGRGWGWWRGNVRWCLPALGLLVVAAALPGRLAPRDPLDQVIQDRLLPPLSAASEGPRYLLGTDDLGRDIFSRIIYGTRTSLLVGVLAVAIACGIGVLAGLVSGYFGRRLQRLDDFIMRCADIQLAFPFILLAIAVIGVLGPSLGRVTLVLGVAHWVVYARIVRSEVLSLREREFIQASRALGTRDGAILLRHVLPNVMASIIVVTSFVLSNIIIAEAGLSFLGLGVPLSLSSWGGMLAQGREFVATAWWLAVMPGLAIFVTALVINLLGDELRDRLDPRLQGI